MCGVIPTVPMWHDINPTTGRLIHVARLFVNKDGFWIYDVIEKRRTGDKTRSVKKRGEENTVI